MNATLVINPGSTSTKIAIFVEDKLAAEETIRHTVEELEQFNGVIDQTEFRTQLIEDFITKEGLINQLVAVVGRGGLLKPIPGGTYAVTEDLMEDLRTEKYKSHASNLGALIAHQFAEKLHIPAFIVDPVVVDEMKPVARIAGLKGIRRRSVAHALNQKAVARKVAEDLGGTYQTKNFVVAHMGGGISIGAHEKGRMIDVINGLDGEGPFSPERSGTLPLMDFAQYMLDHQLTMDQIKRLIAGNAGMKSYLGETDMRIIEKQMAQGNAEVKLLIEAMVYQVAKGIGEMATVLKGNVDTIILTGGIAYSDYIVGAITQATEWIAPIKVIAGEMEMEALYQGARRVLMGEEPALDYSEVKIEE